MTLIKRFLLIIALTMCSACSPQKTPTVPFHEHEGNTYIVERKVAQNDTNEKILEIFTFDKDTVTVTYSQGFKSHNTYYQYDDTQTQNIVKKKMNVFEYFKAIPNTVYFGHFQDIGETMRANTTIYWFTQTSIFSQELENVMKEGKKEYSMSEVSERLSNMKLTQARVGSSHFKKVQNESELEATLKMLGNAYMINRNPRVGDLIVGENYNIKVLGIGAWKQFEENTLEHKGHEYAELNLEIEQKGDLNVWYDTQFELKDHLGIAVPKMGHYVENSYAFTNLTPNKPIKTTIPILYRGDGNYTITLNDYDISFIVER